jgi:hypothetical protein
MVIADRRPEESHFREALRGLVREFVMNKYLLLVAVVLCLGGLVLAAVALDTDGPLLRSFLDCLATRATPAEEIEHRKQLEDAVRRRREAKLQVAEEVIARRISLAEAMKQFRDVDQQWPDARLPPLKAEKLGMSEDEWDGRRVILYVPVVLVDRPYEADAVIARLEKELQELLADRQKHPAAPVEKPIEPSR